MQQEKIDNVINEYKVLNSKYKTLEEDNRNLKEDNINLKENKLKIELKYILQIIINFNLIH